MTQATFTLQYPVEIKDARGGSIETVRELALRRLSASDLSAIADASAKGPGNALQEMVCRVGSIPPSTFNLMDAADAAAVAEIAAGFIGRVLPTGGM